MNRFLDDELGVRVAGNLRAMSVRDLSSIIPYLKPAGAAAFREALLLPSEDEVFIKSIKDAYIITIFNLAQNISNL